MPTRRTAFSTAFGLEIGFYCIIWAIVSLSEVARSKGVLALKDMAYEFKNDELLQKGLLLIADGVGGEIFRKSLEAERYFTHKKHHKGYMILDIVANYGQRKAGEASKSLSCFSLRTIFFKA